MAKFRRSAKIMSIKKIELLDFLWQWGETHGDWGKYLVNTIIQKGVSFTNTERKKIYDIFLNSIGVKRNVQFHKIKRPTFKSKIHSLRLVSMNNIKGVNKLAQGQPLEFSQNLTVIYGENATGKTGYVRILKDLGHCYEKETKILPNVYGKTPVTQSARIDYIVDEKNTHFEWMKNRRCDDLQNIYCFDNNCVKLSIGKERQLLVTPIGFHLFRLVSDELQLLGELQSTHIEQLTSVEEDLSNYSEGTQVYNFLSSLNEKSSINMLKKLASFSTKDANKLQKLHEKIKNLNKKLIEQEIKELRRQAKELTNTISRIEYTSETFTKDDWESLIDQITKYGKLRKVKRASLKDIASKRGIELADSAEFKKFVETAEEYIKILGKTDYPTHEDVCIYCRQQLIDKKAVALLRSYRKLLNDTTQSEIRRRKRKIDQYINTLNSIDDHFIFHHAPFGATRQGTSKIPKYITDYVNKMKKCKTAIDITAIKLITTPKFDIKYKAILSKLRKKFDQINLVLKQKNSLLQNIETQEKNLYKKIHELEDKQKLKQRYGKIVTIIKNKKLAQRLIVNSNLFNTASVSRKTSAARKYLIEDNFNDQFKKELRAMNKEHLKFNINFHSERGQSKIAQDIEIEYCLSDILSESEQKTIALAEFLTEVQLDKSITPVVFDDPVTSLDHCIIDEVARRIVNLSKIRQTVVFTHSILLFNSIKQKSELPYFADLNYKYYETAADLKHAGILNDSPTIRAESFGTYKKEIQSILQGSKYKHNLKDLAIKGYNMLRAAIELIVEQDVLKNTVKRYRKNVALTSFARINGSLIEECKEELNAIFERCCNYTDAHSSILPLASKPSLSELKNDFDKVIEIRKKFRVKI